MSLKIAAEHLKSKGRGSDTELVHMTHGEIKGLRQLAMAHGGDLTINPETGLPEAGFLSKILPVVAAAAATYFTAGAAAPLLETELAGSALAGYGGLMAGAGAGALIGGASSALQGGDWQKSALFGGIGGAIAGGTGAYDAAPVIEPTSTGEITAQGLKAGAATPNSTIPNPEGLSYNPGAGYGTAASGPMTQQQFTDLNAFTGTPQDIGTVPAGGPSPTINNTPTQTEMSQLRGETPPASQAPKPSYYSKLGTGMGDTITKGAILAAPAIGAQYGMSPTNSGQVPTGQSTSTLGRISPNFQAQVPSQPNPYYVAQYPDYKKHPYGMAGGGAVAFANRGIVQDLPRSSGADVGTYSDTDPNTAKLDAYNAALYRFNKVNKKAGIKTPVQFKEAQPLGDIEEAAAGGVMHGIGGYSDGGRMLKGPGDGMSDSIPATIGSKQPARLADGEFVVPADVVSHLGNGSTDAGAKRLYGMMDKIRKARTGKKKQAPEVKANKFLPA